MMPKIFISYRRKDSLLHAGRIFDQLALRFDPKDIFMDFTIPTGGDFPQILQNAVTSCDVCLVIIGMNWENIIYQRTIENADDWVRYEVKMALQRHTDKKCVVMPILVGGATMPDIKLLPDDIHKLNDLHALSVRDFQRDFHNDIAQLVADIHAVVGKSAPAMPTPAPTPSPKIDANATFLLFEEARSAKNWDEARQLLAQLRSVDNLSVIIASTLDDDEKELWEAINHEAFQKKRDEDYQFLRIRAKGDKKRFRTAFDAFSRTYPHYDPDPLGHFASRAYDLLPQPFEW
ncbi:MAG: toll/interleukin-1 receptor domain-containing protein, partial [Phototrophicales bacterium]|nr:toll/interleukin-1 receptor domain-containing protein [Phototrophicales bacterium]